MDNNLFSPSGPHKSVRLCMRNTEYEQLDSEIICQSRFPIDCIEKVEKPYSVSGGIYHGFPPTGSGNVVASIERRMSNGLDGDVRKSEYVSRVLGRI